MSIVRLRAAQGLIWNKPNGGQFANINRPVAGPTHDKELPSAAILSSSIRWAHPTVKVTVMLEELLARPCRCGVRLADKIGDGDQFSGGFVAINPNSKIPRC